MTIGKAFKASDLNRLAQFCEDNDIEYWFWDPAQLIRGEETIEIDFDSEEDLHKVIDFLGNCT